MVAVSLDDLQVEFEGFSIKIDEQGGNRLMELCDKFALDAEGIFNQWMAYASVKNPGDGKSLTLDLLGPFETWMGQTTKSSSAASQSTPKAVKKSVPRSTSTPSRTPLSVANGIKFEENLDADIDIASGYTTPQNRDKLAKRLHTTPEDDGLHKRIISENGSPHMAPRPPKVELFRGDAAAASPSTPSLGYRQRTNKGKILDAFNCDSSSSLSLSSSSSSSGIPPLVGVIDPISGQLLPHPPKSAFKYMMQRPQEVVEILDSAVDELLETLVAENGISDGGGGAEDGVTPTLAHAGVIHQERVWIGGRICCDSVGGGKLNPKSLLLEGTRDSSGGAVVALDVSQLQRYSFFPGQVVLLQGTNPTGKSFLATKIVTASTKSATATTATSTLAPAELQSDLSMLVAAGPFSTSDSDAYEPLVDFLGLVKEQRPKVFVLIGPFVDAKNELVSNTNSQPNELTHESHFEGVVHRVRVCVDSLGGATQCVMLPASRDVHHAFVYPQPPFAGFDAPPIKSFWDPSLLSIGGVLLGATSTDILFHLGAEEISFPPGASDRLARLCAHILAQKSFYPLHPPSEDVNMDYSLYERHATLAKKPHLLILPSELKQFVKDVSGVVCLNPGRLSKGKSGGTYAKVIVPAKAISSKTIKSQIIRI